jgi:hypothetical protein
MKRTSNDEKNQLVAASGRRGFLGKAGATLVAAVAVAAPAQAHAELTPTGLTSRQRMLLKYFAELTDSTQLIMIDMAEEFACTPQLCRHPKLRIAAGGAA